MEPPPEFTEVWALYEGLFRRAGPEVADPFYLAEILPREIAYLKARHAGRPRYAASVHTLGQSLEAPVLAASLLGSEAICLLATRVTESLVPKIAGFLPGVRVRLEVVPADDLDAILAAATRAARGLDAPLALDMTGGTKVMAAAMALAAEHLRADLYYLASQSKAPYRRPVPGSERLVLVRNFAT